MNMQQNKNMISMKYKYWIMMSIETLNLPQNKKNYYIKGNIDTKEIVNII